MSQTVNEKFNQSLLSSASGKRKKGTIFDEIYGALEASADPIDRAIQMIAEFHGAWTGGSQELFALASFLASATKSPVLTNIANTVGGAAQSVLSLAPQLPASLCGKQNTEFAAIMPTPLLREFVRFVHNLHPAINMYLQMHEGNFPYFQQISEEVGRFAQIAMRASEISPMDWPKMGGVNCLNTNTRMDKNTLLKMMPSIFFQMDNASNLLNSLFLRGMRPENNMSLLQPDYGKKEDKLKDKKKALLAEIKEDLAKAREALESGDKATADAYNNIAGQKLDEAEAMNEGRGGPPEGDLDLSPESFAADIAEIERAGKEFKEAGERRRARIAKEKKSVGPVAHGHNFCMDVFGAKRRIDAIAGSAAIVMQKAGDALRLVNKFFPVRQVSKYETETFNITLNRGPNGEPITFITDKRGRLAHMGPTSDSISDPTNDEKLTAKDEHIDEKR